MKKIIYTLALFTGAFLFGSSRSQAQSYDVGTNVINAGIGFGNYVTYGGGSATPVISVSFEHGIAELGPGKVGIGAAIGYQGNSWSYSDGYGDTYKDSWSTLFFAVRGTYHPDFCNGDKYDVYGGIELGYYDYGYSSSSSGPNVGVYSHVGGALASTVGFGILVGGRYYFTNNIGAFAELGYDISYFKIGVAVKFGGK